MEYLDQYLIHFPVSLKPGAPFPFSPEDVVSMDIKSVWTALKSAKHLALQNQLVSVISLARSLLIYWLLLRFPQQSIK